MVENQPETIKASGFDSVAVLIVESSTPYTFRPGSDCLTPKAARIIPTRVTSEKKPPRTRNAGRMSTGPSRFQTRV